MRAIILASTALALAAPAYAQNIYVKDIVHEENTAIARVPVENRGTGKTPARVTVYVGLSNDSAKQGIDYIGVAEQFDVLPGQVGYLNVPILNDAKPGPTKTITTKVIVNSGGTLRDGTGKITRTDSDVVAPPPPPPPAPAAILVGEAACSEGDVCVIPVTRSGGDLSRSATFGWATTTGGTAVPGVDFLARSGSLSFAPGSPTATSPTFPSIENTIDQPDRTVMVRVSSTDAPVAVPQAEIKIVDDDEAPPPAPPPVPCPDGTTVPAGQTCPVPPPPPPSTDVWSFCNHNNFTCFHEGTAKVRYGNATMGWLRIMDPVSGSIECTHETFQVTVPAGLGSPKCETSGKPIPEIAPTTTAGGPGWVPVPTPDGEVPINPSEGDLLPVGVTPDGNAAPDVVGAFRFFCRAGPIKRDDPIVYPGQPGRAHWHQFYGWTSIDAFDTYQSLQTEAGYSTCETPDPAGPRANNHSGYWTSAMIVTVPTGSAVPLKTLTLQPGQPIVGGVMAKPTEHFWVPDGNTLYYKGRPSANCPPSVSPWGPTVQACVPIPHGLKMLFGYDMVKLLDSEAPASYRCIDAAGVQRGPQGPRIADALKDCPVGASLHQKVEAQHCWDPRWLDSPNHQDHLSYSLQRLGTGKGGCKPTKAGATQLVAPPHLTLLTTWQVTQAVVDAVKADPEWGVRLSSDDHLRAIRPKEAWAGRTGHGDFFMSWMAKVRDRWHFGADGHKGCIEGLKNCSAGNTGTGKIMRGGGAPRYPSLGYTSWDHPSNLVPVREEGYSAEW